MRLLYVDFGGKRLAVGLLVLRLVTGAAFTLHGWPKIKNAFGWMGPEADVPGILQAAAAASEFGGGLALIVGLLTPLAALAIACVMVGALAMVHLPQEHPFVARGPGLPSFELAAVYLANTIFLILAGPGRLSLDAALFGGRGRPALRAPPAGVTLSARPAEKPPGIRPLGPPKAQGP